MGTALVRSTDLIRPTSASRPAPWPLLSPDQDVAGATASQATIRLGLAPGFVVASHSYVASVLGSAGTSVTVGMSVPTRSGCARPQGTGSSACCTLGQMWLRCRALRHPPVGAPTIPNTSPCLAQCPAPGCFITSAAARSMVAVTATTFASTVTAPTVERDRSELLATVACSKCSCILPGITCTPCDCRLSRSLFLS